MTKCFVPEGEWCCSPGIYSKEPSIYSLKALEDCIYICVRYSSIPKLLEIDNFCQKTMNHAMIDFMKYFGIRESGPLTKSAFERYLEFTAQFPELIKRVNQNYIASYLGITPSSLSRLKRPMIK